MGQFSEREEMEDDYLDLIEDLLLPPAQRKYAYVSTLTTPSSQPRDSAMAPKLMIQHFQNQSTGRSSRAAESACTVERSSKEATTSRAGC